MSRRILCERSFKQNVLSSVIFFQSENEQNERGKKRCSKRYGVKDKEKSRDVEEKKYRRRRQGDCEERNGATKRGRRRRGGEVVCQRWGVEGEAGEKRKTILENVTNTRETE